MSPSMRREWIEITHTKITNLERESSPSMRREWIEMLGTRVYPESFSSPSMRREWIEIPSDSLARWRTVVSLHAEGVD